MNPEAYDQLATFIVLTVLFGFIAELLNLAKNTWANLTAGLLFIAGTIFGLLAISVLIRALFVG